MFFSAQVHPSASNEHRRALLRESLQRRVVHPRLHYESAEQTRKWLALHRRYSPASSSADTRSIYRRACAQTASRIGSSRIQVISLGCGGGNKDILLLRSLRKRGRAVHYLPCDISLGLVLEAAALAKKQAGCGQITPILCDLACAADLAAFLKTIPDHSGPRIWLFFGVLPNMEPNDARACLRNLLGAKDFLLFSANLFPASISEAGKRRLLPQYDNPETREWLLLFLRDLGVPQDAGRLRFEIRAPPSRPLLKRIEAIFQFRRAVRLVVDDKIHRFQRDDEISLFFSNRHTAAQCRGFLAALNAAPCGEWISASGEEGVFAGQIKD